MQTVLFCILILQIKLLQLGLVKINLSTLLDIDMKVISKIWNKIKSLMKKVFDSEPVYNDKYMKTKISFFNDRVYTNFQHNKIP